MFELETYDILLEQIQGKAQFLAFSGIYGLS